MTSVLRKLSFTITSAVGLTYAVGYLVSSMFYSTWGIYGGSLDFIRAHYIQVGVLCLTPPIVLGIFLEGLCWIYKNRKTKQKNENKDKAGKKWDYESWTLVIGHFTFVLLVLGLYLVALIAQPETLASDKSFQGTMILMPTLCVLGWFGAYYRIQKSNVGSQANSDSVKLVLPCLLWVIVCLLFMGYLIWPTIKDIVWFQTLPICLYLLLASLIGLIGALIGKFMRAGDPPEAHSVIAAVAISLVVLLVFFMIVSFAFGIFPYIPVSRGGADYTQAHPVEIVMSSTDESPATFKNPMTQLPKRGEREFIIVEAGDFVYLACERKDSERFNWRHPGYHPDLIALHRKDIRSIRFLGKLK